MILQLVYITQTIHVRLVVNDPRSPHTRIDNNGYRTMSVRYMPGHPKQMVNLIWQGIFLAMNGFIHPIVDPEALQYDSKRINWMSVLSNTCLVRMAICIVWRQCVSCSGVSPTKVFSIKEMTMITLRTTSLNLRRRKMSPIPMLTKSDVDIKTKRFLKKDLFIWYNKYVGSKGTIPI